MGTLHEQPVRPRLDAQEVFKLADAIRSRYGDEISMDTALMLAFKIEKSYLDQYNRDVWDEQASGFGEKFDAITVQLESLWRVYSDANGC